MNFKRNNKKLNSFKKEMILYSHREKEDIRQIIEWRNKRQKKIKNSRILIIGMGGLGCPLLAYLASSGVCNIGIVDHDKVEISNLHRQILFDSNDIGKFKVNQAKIKIKKIYNQINIKTFRTRITNKNIKKFW